jgi:hypothetical protein
VVSTNGQLDLANRPCSSFGEVYGMAFTHTYSLENSQAVITLPFRN